MNLRNIRLRIKIPILIGLLSFLLFFLLFLMTEFGFSNLKNPSGNNVLTFKLLGLYLSLFFSSIVGGVTYYALGFIYKIFKHAAMDLSDTDLQFTPSIENSEEADFLRTLKLSLLQGQNSASFQVSTTKGHWEEHRSLLINHLMPDMELTKISGWDISIYPSQTRSANSDYIQILKTKDGFVGILAGFIETGITESAQKLFVHGLISALKDFELTTLELLGKIESSLHGLALNELKLSLFGLDSEKDKLRFLHFMDMPIFQFSNQGIQVIEGTGDDSWHALHPHELSIADGIELGDYLVWGTDRALKEFGLTSFEIMEEFVDYLLDLNPKSSRELLLAIAKKMSALGKERNLLSPLDNMSIIVVKRTK
jgi:Arg-Lys translocation region protein phosphatase